MDKKTFNGLSTDDSLMQQLVKACKSITVDNNANNEAIFNVLEPEELVPERDKSISKAFNYDEYAPHINLNCINEDSEGGNATPFKTLRDQMVYILEDKISKKIIRHGIEPLPNNAAVYLQYNSYTEFEEIPFDSSYLRNSKPLRYQLGKNEYYPGFEFCIRSMAKGEKSQFLVHHSYAFGEKGVPPRIPESATILLEIELINFVDCCAIQNQLDDNCSFETVYKHADSYKSIGNDYFSNKNMIAALSYYKKGEKLMYSCATQNIEEEVMKKKLRIKLMVNMMICYNKLKLYSKTCSCAKDAFYSLTDEAQMNCKLFYQLGKAQMGLCEFKKACKSMKQALKFSPHSKEIIDALVELDETQKLYNLKDQLMWKKAIGHGNDKSVSNNEKEAEIRNMPEEGSVSQEFKTFITEIIADFIRQNSKQLMLPTGLTFREIEACEIIASQNNVVMYDKIVDGVQTFYVAK